MITFAWYYSTRWTSALVAQVIWVIGASMVVLAGLIHLPRPAIAAFGLTLVLGHNLLDGIPPAASAPGPRSGTSSTSRASSRWCPSSCSIR